MFLIDFSTAHQPLKLTQKSSDEIAPARLIKESAPYMPDEDVPRSYSELARMSRILQSGLMPITSFPSEMISNPPPITGSWLLLFLIPVGCSLVILPYSRSLIRLGSNVTAEHGRDDGQESQQNFSGTSGLRRNVRDHVGRRKARKRRKKAGIEPRWYLCRGIDSLSVPSRCYSAT